MHKDLKRNINVAKSIGAKEVTITISSRNTISEQVKKSDGTSNFSTAFLNWYWRKRNKHLEFDEIPLCG